MRSTALASARINAVLLPAFAAGLCAAQPVRVRDADGLRRAAAAAKPGTTILMEPGEYPGGIFLNGLRGEPGKPIVIGAADPKARPLIRGGAVGMHLTDPAHVEIRDLAFRGATGNGLNIDDGGSFDTPAHHLVLRGLRVQEVGSNGNHDGIKLSGVDDFRIEACVVERWGIRGGSGVDMVGCHRGVIEGNLLRHAEEAQSTGIQAKGASSDIAIRGNRFESAGGRAVNAGGSTGLAYFRPPLSDAKPEGRSEAKDIVVEGNVFIGGGAAVAFVGVDGAVVRFNTIYRPRGWGLRILQENAGPGFVPSRNGRFSDNLVVFKAGEWKGAVNVGPKTAPETFELARNSWYAMDRPDRSRPSLPVSEKDGAYGKDPLFVAAEEGDLRVRPGSPAQKTGAHAMPKAPAAASGAFDPLRPEPR